MENEGGFRKSLIGGKAGELQSMKATNFGVKVGAAVLPVKNKDQDRYSMQYFGDLDPQR